MHNIIFLLMTIGVSVSFQNCNLHSDKEETQIATIINVRELYSVIDSTYRNNPINYRKEIKLKGDSLLISFHSSDSVFNSKFSDTYFQFLIYQSRNLLTNIQVIGLSLDTKNQRAGIYIAFYDTMKIKRIIDTYSEMNSFRLFVRYSLDSISMLELIKYDASLSGFYETLNDLTYNMEFRDLLFQYSKHCDGLSNDSSAIKTMRLLTRFNMEFLKNETQSKHLNYFNSHCDPTRMDY